MKKKIPALLIFFAATSFCAIALAAPAHAAALSSVKLPYTKDESFIVSQGYNSLPTHIKKDAYALDFTQNGCEAYGKAVVATASGTAMFVSEEGYNGGYGTELIIDHGDNIVSRYAHMIPDSVAVAQNNQIRQGETIGYVGDTGLVAGAACANHPGTHLHFAMDTVNADGTFTALDPEPISGYTNMTEEHWYTSDNGEDDSASADTISPVAVGDSVGDVLGVYDSTSDETSSIVAVPSIATSTTPIVIPVPPSPVAAPIVVPAVVGNDIPSGGVSAISPDATSIQPPAPVVAPVVAPPLSPPLSDNSSSTENAANIASTTIATDATSTSVSSLGDSATSTASTTIITTVATSTPTTTISTPDASPTSTPALFSQTVDTAQSPQSWYDDNWFDLGNGYAGTLNTLTLEGKVSDVHYFASHIWLQEFKDQNYTAMIQQFTISDNAPFTDVMATATFSGLAIPLKPYFYYRLATNQDYQNRSVILAGTPNTTVGTVMWNSFIYGTGRVESTSPYFPYMIMEGIAATSTTTSSPPLPAPSDMIIDFDDVGMQLTPSFSVSTDPEWPANPLHFEMNYSTSSSLADSGWTVPGPIPVAIGNSYLIGVRERDNYGDVSAPATTTWNFPVGFSPYILSPGMSYAAQYFNVPVTSTLQSIALFTTNLQTGARFPTGIWCTLSLYDSYNQASYGNTPSDNTISGYGCAGNPVFSFASSPLVLSPSHHYQWIFQAQTGNESTNASVQFYGTKTDTAGGLFNNSSLVNARFIVNGGSGVLFSN